MEQFHDDDFNVDMTLEQIIIMDLLLFFEDAFNLTEEDMWKNDSLGNPGIYSCVSGMTSPGEFVN